jgi:hypothetical protein
MKSSPHTCPINKGFWVGNKIVNGTAVQYYNFHMKFSSPISVITILVLSMLTGNVYAQNQTQPQAQTQEQTDSARYSIAIRGGASKGAYEAGYNWSVLKFIREMSESQTFTGGQLYQLDLESISGASAGGINTLLSGLTWCSLPENEGGISNRIDNNVFRDI